MGYIESEPLNNLLPFIDAMNIDLKCFSNEFYNELGGSLEPVKETILNTFPHCHIEITTLVIPGKNDRENEIRDIASWLSGIDKNIPLHITRFFPRYKMSELLPTDTETIYKLRDIALKHLNYVYAGNI